MIQTENVAFEIDEIVSPIYDLGGVYLYKTKDQIVVSEYYQDTVLDIDLALKVHSKIGELTDGKEMNQLFLACTGLNVTHETREWGVTEMASRYTKRSAIVCNTLAHRIIGNFIINVQRPSKPTKMFSTVKKASDWLLEQ